MSRLRSGRTGLSCMSCKFPDFKRGRKMNGEVRNADSSRYHHLNHWSIFGGGYRSGAVSIMKGLIRKYQDSDGGEE
jgi:hypothetical protein